MLSHARHTFLGHIDCDRELGESTYAAAVEAVEDSLSDEKSLHSTTDIRIGSVRVHEHFLGVACA